jgi:hypothetical protein
MNRSYDITSYWGARPEAADALAGRLKRFLGRLSAIGPEYSSWSFARAGKRGRLDPSDIRALATMIEKSVARSDDGRPEPESGYQIVFGNWNDRASNLESIVFHVNAGCSYDASYFTNCVSLATEPQPRGTPSRYTYEVLKAIMLAIIDCWDVTYCAAINSDLLYLEPSPAELGRAFFRLAWIAYISPRLASLLRPPPPLMTERLPNGGILMTATTEQFEVDNPDHVAGARGIAVALAPINARPWPPDK